MEINDRKIKVGVSTCLLGEKVRYDGGHKNDAYISKTLAQYFDFLPVCPEVECGLPVPREAMRLVQGEGGTRLLTQKTGIDHTKKMEEWGTRRLAALETVGLRGYIFKSKSPSSGMERVKVYGASSQPARNGVGVWAGMFIRRFPLLPVEEEGRLHDPALRENFIERVFVMDRWLDLFEAASGGSSKASVGKLVDFHTVHKLLVMAHSVAAYRSLGKLVAHGGKMDTDELYATYAEGLFAALKRQATPRGHHNVLLHIMGYFKKDISAEEKQELLEMFDSYRHGAVPLIVPVTLLNHFVRKYQKPYLAGQYYLHPHPVELKLRNWT